MITQDWLMNATKKLLKAGISSAQLDALILLEDELGIDRAHLLAHPEQPINPGQLKTLNDKLASRSRHEPLSYIRERVEFYGRNFKLNHDVLEPRVESEIMIELFIELVNSQAMPDHKIRVIDVGTGSGAIGITAALEVVGIEIVITDIDPACLALAANNAKTYGVMPTIVQGNLLEPLVDTTYDGPTILLANLPYVPDSWQINQAAMMEPRIAIFGGPDGMDLYRTMFEQIISQTWKPAFILAECLPPHHQALADIAYSHGYTLNKSKDFIQLFELK